MEKSLMKLEFSNEQVDLIKKQIAPGTTDDQLKLFIYQCRRTGLDPLTRQIYCMLRNAKNKDTGQYEKKMTIQTSIDGFRVIAERSGDYGGQGKPVFNELDGKLISAEVTVYRFRGDIRYEAAVGVAYWNEYVPQSGQDQMWQKMPHAMLSKVAEALALRKAYPQDLSGLYTNDEMQQSDTTDTTDVTILPAQTESDIELLIDMSETVNELGKLYKLHSSMFETNADLKAKLSSRKSQLKAEKQTV